MKQWVAVFILMIPLFGIAQEVKDTTADTSFVDTKYREDQFYFAVTYNLLSNKPNGMSQSGFSNGFQLGFIRDMPINEKRTLAIGLGLGIASNSYNHNLMITKVDDDYNYSIIDESEITYNKNKFSTYLIEMPFEFRWRQSTPTEYKFWRIYTGFKLSYVLANRYKFRGSTGDVTYSNIDDFEKWQYGITFGAGYATWNFYIYYGLNPIFNNTVYIDQQSLDVSDLKIGLIFYIL